MDYRDLIPLDGPEWMDRAACADPVALDSFTFTMQARPAGLRAAAAYRIDERRAIAVCRVCPVLRECGEYADQHEERFGIWGGLVRGRS